MTRPSVARTRALRQRLFTPVKVSSDPPVHSRGGLCSMSSNTCVSAITAGHRHHWLPPSLSQFGCCPFPEHLFCDCIHEVSEQVEEGAAWWVMLFSSICNLSRGAFEYVAAHLLKNPAVIERWLKGNDHSNWDRDGTNRFSPDTDYSTLTQGIPSIDPGIHFHLI